MYLIGIAGGSGSGKTTFAKKIVKLVNSSKLSLIHQDSYYLSSPPKDLYRNNAPNFDHPESFDWILQQNQLGQLKLGKKIAMPIYDYLTSSRTKKTESIGPCEIVIMEGIYALWDESIRKKMDLKIFLDVDADIRFIRRLHRDVKERGRNIDNIISQYYDSVRPMHRQHIEATRQFADLTVGEENDIPAEVIASRIFSLISNKQKDNKK